MKCDSCGTKDQKDFGADHETCVECKRLKKGIEKRETNPPDGRSPVDYNWMLETRRENVKINAERKKRCKSTFKKITVIGN